MEPRTLACMPADFQPHAAILINLGDLLSHHTRLALDLVSALIDRIPLLAIVPDERHRAYALTALCDWGLPAHRVHFIILPAQGTYVRDYGPAFVRRSDTGITLLDPEFAPDQPTDDRVAGGLARLLHLPTLPVPLTLDGGHILSSGHGFCLLSNAIRTANASRDYSPQQIVSIVGDCYGFQNGAFLHPLANEPTGRIDLFAAFLAPDLLLMGAADPAVDPQNAELLDSNAAMLSGAPTPAGPLHVRRVPLSVRPDGSVRSYTSVLFVNDTILFPSYPDESDKMRTIARGAYELLLRDWRLLEVDIATTQPEKGSLRRLALNLPWLTDHFPPLPHATENAPRLTLPHQP